MQNIENSKQTLESRGKYCLPHLSWICLFGLITIFMISMQIDRHFEDRNFSNRATLLLQSADVDTNQRTQNADTESFSEMAKYLYPYTDKTDIYMLAEQELAKHRVK